MEGGKPRIGKGYLRLEYPTDKNAPMLQDGSIVDTAVELVQVVCNVCLSISLMVTSSLFSLSKHYTNATTCTNRIRRTERYTRSPVLCCIYNLSTRPEAAGTGKCNAKRRLQLKAAAKDD